MGGWQLEWQEKCQPTYRGNRFDLDKESGIKGGNLDLDNNEGIFIHNFKSEVLYLILAITKHIFNKLEISISRVCVCLYVPSRKPRFPVDWWSKSLSLIYAYI